MTMTATRDLAEARSSSDQPTAATPIVALTGPLDYPDPEHIFASTTRARID
jgi:hypothetical protein